MWTVILLALTCIMLGLLTGAIHLIHEQGKQLREGKEEAARLHQEIRVLNDSIARGSRTPIMRHEPVKKLERLDNWFDGAAKIETVKTG